MARVGFPKRRRKVRHVVVRDHGGRTGRQSCRSEYDEISSNHWARLREQTICLHQHHHVVAVDGDHEENTEACQEEPEANGEESMN